MCDRQYGADDDHDGRLCTRVPRTDAAADPATASVAAHSQLLLLLLPAVLTLIHVCVS